ncbi:MAG: hypothetical protein M1827_007714 [Pycnora praestabilis]|nr:MAG: hypothetical protein M1827_007714 [Pycnora praestabilis]
MQPPSFLSLLFLSSILFSFSWASPVPVDHLDTRQLQLNPAQYNCSNPDQDLQQECWDELDVTGYLGTWWENHSASCVGETANFSACFLNYVGIYNQQCDLIGQGLCQLSTSDLSSYEIHDAYVIYSIHLVYQWFNSINTALFQAETTAAGPIGVIVEKFNPPETKNTLLSELLVALAAAVGSLPFPAAVAGKVVGMLLTPVMQQIPGVLKYLYPKSSLDSTVSQINQISDHLSELVSTTSQNLGNALGAALDEQDTFVAITAHGGFIAPASSLLVQTESLTLTLNTFVISQCLKANNIFLTGAWDTNPQQWTVNNTLVADADIQCSSYNSYGVCSAWWWDSDQNNAYGLDDQNSMTNNFYDDMNWIFENFTTGELLFRGAKECADYVFAGGNATATIDDNLVPRCISSLDLCVYNQQLDLNIGEHALFTNDYPVSNCGQKNKNYGVSGCGGGAGGINVPASYLGPFMYNQSSKGYGGTMCRNHN